MTKRELALLGRVFDAEIAGLLPFQTRSKLALKMLEAGYLVACSTRWSHSRTFGPFALTIEGYRLSEAGRLAYCESCGDGGD